MGLYPSTYNDGTADHTLVLRGPLPVAGNSVVTEYFEPGSSLEARNKYLIPKGGSKVMKNLSQFVMEMPIDADGNTRPVTVNTSVVFDKRHDEAEIAKLVVLSRAGIDSQAGALNFVRRLP